MGPCQVAHSGFIHRTSTSDDIRIGECPPTTYSGSHSAVGLWLSAVELNCPVQHSCTTSNSGNIIPLNKIKLTMALEPFLQAKRPTKHDTIQILLVCMCFSMALVKCQMSSRGRWKISLNLCDNQNGDLGKFRAVLSCLGISTCLRLFK